MSFGYYMQGLGAVTEADITALLQNINRSWPQGSVTGTDLAVAVKAVEPLARKLQNYRVGQKFTVAASLLAAGNYEVTQKDRDAADRVIYELVRLPIYGNQLVDAQNLRDIKAAVMQVALTGSYLDASPSVGALLVAELKRLGSATAEAAREAPGRLLGPLTQPGGKPLVCGTPLGTFRWDCWSTPAKVAVVASGVGLAALVTWIIVKTVKTALPVAAKVAERRLSGVESRRRRRRR